MSGNVRRIVVGVLTAISMALVGVVWWVALSQAQMQAGTINAKQSGTWTVQPGNTANTTAWLVNAAQSGTWTVQPGNTANTTAWLVTGTGGTFPTTQAALTLTATGQQAVTATATALATQAAKSVCIKNIAASTQIVYFGVSGVTTTTGMELDVRDTWCGTIANVNQVFVIAGATGSTVAWEALN